MFDLVLSVPEFYIRPKTFFQNFFLKDDKERLLYTAFYLLIWGAFFYLYTESNLKQIFQIISSGLITLVVAIIVLKATHFFMSLFFTNKVQNSEIFYFVLLSKIFISPIVIVFQIYFLVKENYDFYLWYNIFLLVLFFFIYLYSNSILYKKKGLIVLGFLLNVIFFNLTIIFRECVSFDKFEGKAVRLYNDEIIEEYTNKIETIDSVVVNNFPIQSALIITDHQRISTYIFDDIKAENFPDSMNYEIKLCNRYLAFSNHTRQKVPFIRDSLKFTRNRILSDSLKSYVDYVCRNSRDIETPDSSLLTRTVVFVRDSVDEMSVKFYNLKPEFYSNAYKYLNTRAQLVNSRNKSCLPTMVWEYLFWPSIYILKIKGAPGLLVDFA